MLYAFDSNNWTDALENVHIAKNGLKGLAPGDVLVYDFRGGKSCSSATARGTRENAREGEGLHDGSLGSPNPPQAAHKPLRVVQWNIERGYKLEGIIKELESLDADVILLQELDISCQRSNFANVPLALAKALGALCAFVCEFHELPSTPSCKRNEDSESGCEFAFHGNAIITRRHLLHSIRTIEHSCGLDWSKCGYERKEPRIGTRYVLTGCIDSYRGLPIVSAVGGARVVNPTATGLVSATPSASGFGGSSSSDASFIRVQLYTLHLEIFCGPLMRLRQLSDAIHDAKERRRNFYSHAAAANAPSDADHYYGDGGGASLGSGVARGGGEGAGDMLLNYAVPLNSQQHAVLGAPRIPQEASVRQRHFSVIIGGDLNTIMHGIVRFSGLYSDDRLRWMSLGETEAEWLQRKVFSIPRRRWWLNHKNKRERTNRGGVSKSKESNERLHERLNALPASPTSKTERSAALSPPSKNQTWTEWARSLYWRYCYGLKVEYSARLSNEELKLYDVFDKLRDITLDNPAYKGFVTGKLDWLLLSNIRVVAKSIGNNDYSLSDHKYLLNDVVLPPFTAAPPGAVFLTSPTSATEAQKSDKTDGKIGAEGGEERDSPSLGELCTNAIGNSSFFWADDSLAAAYNSHTEKRSFVTSALRCTYVGLGSLLAFYLPYKIIGSFAANTSAK